MTKIACCILSLIVVAGCTSPKYSNKLKSIQLTKTTNSWNGQPLPPYKKGVPEITILRITIPPNYNLPMHMHPSINAGVLLKGKLTVTTKKGKTLHLKPYDSIVEVVDTWHYGKNTGSEPAEIIVFYAGEKGEKVTILKTKKK